MKKILPIVLCTTLAACGGTTVIDTNNAEQVSEMKNTMQLEYRDWVKTAEHMTDSMLKSGAFAKVKNPVIAVSDIKNDTMQRIDSDILIKKIRTTIVNSGHAQIATNFIGEDTTSNTVRNTRGNSEYDQSTFVSKGTLVAPNMSLSGKMIQRNLDIDSGWFSRVDTRVEYYLQLTLTDLKTGLSVWEDEQPILKTGTDAPNW
ncbi:MAG: penicillin-binding protein activator LpoB [Alphaproteobacteria bacterium]|nr:penicillin-binding protein activator LpoB [Alphaproteobacteria bacterium]